MVVQQRQSSLNGLVRGNDPRSGEVGTVTGMYVYAAAALLAAGMVIGILVMVCLGIKRDDRPGGFPADAHDRMARATRKITGAGARSTELAASRRHDTLSV